ncbi:MAG: FeoB small GTPase domain-containing protein [Bacillota bacterium]
MRRRLRLRHRRGNERLHQGERCKAQRSARVVLVGSPNAGKSALFYRLTGTYVTVSNYPGTTVEVAQGRAVIGEQEFEIIDTPGLYSLLAITEEERVTRRLLFDEGADLILHVVDANNPERALHLTLQLVEAGLPVILVLNMLDEAERLGLNIDIERLSRELKIPVVGTIATTGQGIELLRKVITEHVRIAS